MKVFFVGVHNKPNTPPLCSSTKSGKLIDRIIELLDCKNVIKTNLYDTETMPNVENKHQLASDWVFKYQPNYKDVIILLGGEVKKSYIRTVGRVIDIPHPAKFMTYSERLAYINDTAKEINKLK